MRAIYNKLLRQTFLQSLHTLRICAKTPCLVGDSTALCEARRVKARTVPLPPPMVPLWSVPVPECFLPLIMLQAIVNVEKFCLAVCRGSECVRNLRLLQQWIPISHAQENWPCPWCQRVYFPVWKLIVNLNDIGVYCQIVLQQRIQLRKTDKQEFHFPFVSLHHCGISWNLHCSPCQIVHYSFPRPYYGNNTLLFRSIHDGRQGHWTRTSISTATGVTFASPVQCE